jgi:hypothetical protein
MRGRHSHPAKGRHRGWDDLQVAADQRVAPGSKPCYFIVGIKDGKTIAPNGLTPVCVKSST